MHTKVADLFPARCSTHRANRLFCDVSSCILPTAVRAPTNAIDSTFVDLAQRVGGDLSCSTWASLLDQFEPVPAFDLSRVTERIVQRGKWPVAVVLHHTWLKRELIGGLRGKRSSFPFEFAAAAPSSLTSGLMLRMLYLSMRGAAHSSTDGPAMGSIPPLWMSGELALHLRPALLAASIRVPERILWQRLIKLVACTAALDSCVAEFRREGKQNRAAVKGRCLDLVHRLLQPVRNDLETDPLGNIAHIFEKVITVYEDCSRFSNTSRVRIGPHKLWLTIVSRVWSPWVSELQLTGGCADALVTHYSLDVLSTAASLRSAGREMFTAHLLAHGLSGKSWGSAMSTREAQQRVTDPSPFTRHTTLRAPEGATDVAELCLVAQDVVQSFMTRAYEAWSTGMIGDLPPISIFFRYFRLLCRCGCPALVRSVLDDVVPMSASATAKLLSQESVVAVSRSGGPVEDLIAVFELQNAAISTTVRDRAVLTCLQLQRHSDVENLLPAGRGACSCPWWNYFVKLPFTEQTANVPSVVAHFSSIASAIAQPVPLRSIRFVLQDDALLYLSGTPLHLAAALYSSFVRLVALIGRKSPNDSCRHVKSDETARDETSVAALRNSVLRSVDVVEADEVEWQLFVLLSCAHDLELIASLVRRAQSLPATGRTLGLISRLLHELGLTSAKMNRTDVGTVALAMHEGASFVLSLDELEEALLRLGCHVAQCASQLPPTSRERDTYLSTFVGDASGERRAHVVLPTLQVDSVSSPQGLRFGRRTMQDVFGDPSARSAARCLAQHGQGNGGFGEGVLRRYT